MTQMIALNAAEMAELASCETVIEHGLKVFHAVGLALLTIREKRLYRAAFATFEDYCQAKWGFTDEHARRLMRGAEVVNNLTETPTNVGVLPDGTPPMGGVLPTSERQVRPLLGLPPEQQREVWQQAVETAPNGKVTGAHVEKTAQQFKPTTSRRSGVNFAGDGAEPDLDEDGQPLRRRYADEEEEEEDDIFHPGDIVRYNGVEYNVRAAGGSQLFLDVPSRHPLRNVGIDNDEVKLIARRYEDRQPAAPSAKPATSPIASPPAGPTMEETSPHIDGVSIAKSHPTGWKLLFVDASKLECLNCGTKSARWSPVRGRDWRCEACKQLTHDDLLIAATDAAHETSRAADQATANLPFVDGMRIDESHPVGYAGLYATDDAIGYGRATCSACGKTHNGWTPIRAGQWKCQKCGEATNDDAMHLLGKAEYDLEKRMAHYRRNGSGHKPAPDPISEDVTNDEWGTPVEWVEKARAFLRVIDTDPATNDAAQRIVKANWAYTKLHNGLQQEWRGRVWLNPPYSYPLVERFADEAIRQYRGGKVEECLILVNSRTDAAWFQRLLAEACAVLFIKERINFIHATKESAGNRQGQVLFYLGSRPTDFVLEFSNDGIPMQCMWSREGD